MNAPRRILRTIELALLGLVLLVLAVRGPNLGAMEIAFVAIAAAIVVWRWIAALR